MIVTCNYRMTVDAVRHDLAGTDVWLLVLETFGINVWCAAGKKTFGTDELVRRIFATHLADHVARETLILPQLGAVGVSANAVRVATGYRVVWGPVRSADLRAFLSADLKATPKMRAVTFRLPERLALAPMEVVPSLRYALWAVPLMLALAVIGASIGARAFAWQAALMALFPSVLGFAMAASVAIGVVCWFTAQGFENLGPGMLGGMNPWGWAGVLLPVTAAASYVGVNFTGSTPYTSPSGVEAELRAALPIEGAALAVGLICWTVSWALHVGPLWLGR